MSEPKKKAAPRKRAAPKKARAATKKRATTRKPAAKKRASENTTAKRKPAAANRTAKTGTGDKQGKRTAGTVKRKKATGRRIAAGASEPEQQSLLPPDPMLDRILDERLLVPQKVAAMAFGISIEALKKWKIKPETRRGREALYYLPHLIRHRIDRADATDNDLSKNRARLAAAQADETELRIAQLRGNLIPADVLLENWEPLVGAARQKVLAIPAKLKSQIPALTDDDLKLITEVCRGTLEDLANGGIPRRTKQSARATL